MTLWLGVDGGSREEDLDYHNQLFAHWAYMIRKADMQTWVTHQASSGQRGCYERTFKL